MTKPVQYCFLVLLLAALPSLSNAAAEGAVAAPVSAMDMGPMPLVSRSLAELAGSDVPEPVASVDTPAHKSSGTHFFLSKASGVGRLLDPFVEPFYLSLLGISLLLLGTIKSSRN